VPAGKDTDFILIDKLQKGDLDALEQLMQLYRDDLFKLAYRYLGRREDAEEILQDTFLRAFQKIGTFQRKSSIGTWLYRICINLCITKKKSNQRTAQTISLTPDESTNSVAFEPAIKNAPDPAHFDLQKIMQHSIARLKPIEGMIVTLYYMQGYSCSEISEIVDKRINTVKTHLSRARQKLKIMVKPYELHIRE